MKAQDPVNRTTIESVVAQMKNKIGARKFPLRIHLEGHTVSIFDEISAECLGKYHANEHSLTLLEIPASVGYRVIPTVGVFWDSLRKIANAARK